MDLSAAGRKIARFGLFEADLEQGILTKRGLRIRLQDQPFQVLVLLLQRVRLSHARNCGNGSGRLTHMSSSMTDSTLRSRSSGRR